MTARRHLVLGGGGFIGSHLVKRLVANGHQVAAADIQFPSYRGSQWAGATLMKYDLRSPTNAHLVVQSWLPDVVWQLAADMGGVEFFHSSRDWGAAVSNNQINAAVMSAVANAGLPIRTVFTSTACALATEKQTHDLALREGHPDWESIPAECRRWELSERDIEWGTPDQLYGQEKRHSAILWQNAPVESRVCFLHTVYGPYQEHEGIRMKLPMAVAQKARAARETGEIELLGDGNQIRTFMYVDDAVDRLVALGASDTDPGFVNIGGTQPFRVDEVAVVACNAAGWGYQSRWNTPYPELRHVAGPTGVEARGCDMTKFNYAFQWFKHNPDVTLVDGLKRTITWLDEIGAAPWVRSQ